MENQLTKQDLFEIVNGIVNKVVNDSNQDLLEVINKSFSEIEQRMVTKADLIELRMTTKSDLAATETRLVTKDYLDKKLSEFRGDLLEVIKKEDNKLGTQPTNWPTIKFYQLKKFAKS